MLHYFFLVHILNTLIFQDNDEDDLKNKKDENNKNKINIKPNSKEIDKKNNSEKKEEEEEEEDDEEEEEEEDDETDEEMQQVDAIIEKLLSVKG